MNCSIVRSRCLPLNVSVTVLTAVVVLVGMLTACTPTNKSSNKFPSRPAEVTALDSRERIASALKREGATLNLYWPAGGTIKTWIIDKLVPGYKAYVKQQYGVDITVNILTTKGGDRTFFQKIQAYERANPNHNNFDIDVVRVVPSVELLEAVKKGLLLPVLPDYAKLLPNGAKVNQPGLQSFTIEGKTYAIPVYQPTISFFYNQERVANPPQSVRELLDWAKANPQRFTYEDPRSSVGIGSGAMFLLAVMKTFGDPNNPYTYKQGFKFLEELQPYIYPQPTESSRMIELMERGDIWLMAFWNDFGLSAVRDRKIVFMTNYFPKEGTPVRNTPIAIPESAAHKLAGLLFLNYTLSDEVQRELALLTQQIPASTSEGVWKDLPIDTFNYDFAYIQSHTFAAFNSEQNLTSIKTIVAQFPQQVLKRSSPFNLKAPLSTPKALTQTQAARQGEAKRLMTLGKEQYQRGQLKAALKSFQQALTVYRKIGHRQGEAASLNVIGLNYYMLGYSTQALKLWQQSSAIYRKIGYRAEERQVLFKIGAVYENLGRYSQALKFYQQSLAIAREIGDRSNERAIIREISSVRSRLGQYPQPLEFYEGIGEALLRSGELVEASTTLLVGIRDLESVRQGLSDSDKISIFEAQAAAYRVLQKVLIAQGKTAAALEISERGRVRAFAELLAFRLSSKPTAQIPPPTVKQIQQIAKEQNATLVEYSIIFDRFQVQARPQRQESELYIWVIKPTGEAAFRRVDLTFLWQKQNSSLKELTPNSPSVVTTTPELGHELTTHWSHSGVLVQLTIGTALLILSAGSVFGIAVLSSRFFLTRKAAPASQAKPRQLQTNPQNNPQKQGKVLFHYQRQDNSVLKKPLFLSLLVSLAVVSCGGGLFFWMTRNQPIAQKRNIGNDSFLAQLVDSTHESLKTRGRGLEILIRGQNTSQTQRLKLLHQILIEPIADLLPKDANARVIFIPQHSLFLVPFPALQDKQGKYLIEKHTVLTAPSIQTLDLTRKQRQRLAPIDQLPLQGQQALIVGNPTMPTVPLQIGEPPQQLASLPGAEQEAIAIANLLKTQAITGNQATKASVVQKMSKARIVHLATHGILDDIRGLGSAIALAPDASPPWQGGLGGSNGLLTAEEIFKLKLNAELIVLSACDTGRGRITGDGVVGLSRSLISAGVPSVIVSLWAVPDAPTAFLMTEYYRNWQKHPDKAQALRQAMLTTRKQHPNPRDWAAFTLIGEAE